MADETEATPTPEKKKSGIPAVGIAIGGMAGVTVAMLFVSPMVVANRTATPPAQDRTEASESHAAPRGGEGHGGSGGATGELGNLLVNPAGSRGLRFLMASVTLEVLGDNSRAVGDLRRRDAQLRDLVIGVLETYTLDDLTGPGARDTAKQHISVAVDSTFGVHVEVYMPQFVIN